MKNQSLVSIHGGHSGQFCNHAEDSLEEVIQSYIEKGFTWVGISEHIPPPNDHLMYDDEKQAGHTCASLHERFSRYMQCCKALKEKYADRISIFVGFEAEAYTGYRDHVTALIEEFAPDYYIGSVHHVRDMCFDASKERYMELARSMGGLIPLYCAYFDAQYEQIETLKPPVIGHFDYIRYFDPDYLVHLQDPSVRERIERNLQIIRRYDLIMDYNVSPLWEGEREPHMSGWILRRAFALGITVIPGDDSHGTKTVGAAIEDGIKILKDTGFDTSFPMPKFQRGNSVGS